MFKIKDKLKAKNRNKKNIFPDTTTSSNTKAAFSVNQTCANTSTDKTSVDNPGHSSVFTTQHPALSEEECQRVKKLLYQLNLQ